MALSDLESIATLAIVIKARNEAKEAFSEIRKDANETGKESGDGIGSGISKGAKIAAGTVAALGGAIVGFGVESVHHVEEVGEAAYDMGEKFGMSGKQATTWIAIGGMVGVSTEQMSGSLQRMSRSMSTATAEQDKANKALSGSDRLKALQLQQQQEKETVALAAATKQYGANSLQAQLASAKLADTSQKLANVHKASNDIYTQLGINLRNTNGTLKSQNDILIEVAEAFQKMPDGPLKTADAMKLFGRAGAEMLPLLNEGKEGIDKFTAAAIEQGQVLSEDQVKAAHQATMAHKELDLAMASLGNQLGIFLLPKLTSMTNIFLNDVIPVMRSVINWVSGGIIQGFQLFGGILNTYVIPYVRELVGWLKDGLTNTMSALSGFMRSEFIPRFTEVTVWMHDHVQPALAAIAQVIQNDVMPFLARMGDYVGGQFLNVLKTIADLVVHLVVPGLQLFSQYSNITSIGLQVLNKVMMQVWTVVHDTLLPIIERFANWLQVSVPIALQTTWTWIHDYLLPILASVADFLVTNVFKVFQTMWDWLSTNIPQAIGVLGNLWNDHRDIVTKALGAIWSFIQNQLMPVISGFIDGLRTLLPAALTLFGEAIHAVTGFLIEHRDTIIAIAGFIKDQLVNALKIAVLIFQGAADVVKFLADHFWLVEAAAAAFIARLAIIKTVDLVSWGARTVSTLLQMSTQFKAIASNDGVGAATKALLGFEAQSGSVFNTLIPGYSGMQAALAGVKTASADMVGSLEQAIQTGAAVSGTIAKEEKAISQMGAAARNGGKDIKVLAEANSGLRTSMVDVALLMTQAQQSMALMGNQTAAERDETLRNVRANIDAHDALVAKTIQEREAAAVTASNTAKILENELAEYQRAAAIMSSQDAEIKSLAVRRDTIGTLQEGINVQRVKQESDEAVTRSTMAATTAQELYNKAVEESAIAAASLREARVASDELAGAQLALSKAAGGGTGQLKGLAGILEAIPGYAKIAAGAIAVTIGMITDAGGVRTGIKNMIFGEDTGQAMKEASDQMSNIVDQMKQIGVEGLNSSKGMDALAKATQIYIDKWKDTGASNGALAQVEMQVQTAKVTAGMESQYQLWMKMGRDVPNALQSGFALMQGWAEKQANLFASGSENYAQYIKSIADNSDLQDAMKRDAATLFDVANSTADAITTLYTSGKISWNDATNEMANDPQIAAMVKEWKDASTAIQTDQSEAAKERYDKAHTAMLQYNSDQQKMAEQHRQEMLTVMKQEQDDVRNQVDTQRQVIGVMVDAWTNEYNNLSAAQKSAVGSLQNYLNQHMQTFATTSPQAAAMAKAWQDQNNNLNDVIHSLGLTKSDIEAMGGSLKNMDASKLASMALDMQVSNKNATGVRDILARFPEVINDIPISRLSQIAAILAGAASNLGRVQGAAGTQAHSATGRVAFHPLTTWIAEDEPEVVIPQSKAGPLWPFLMSLVPIAQGGIPFVPPPLMNSLQATGIPSIGPATLPSPEMMQAGHATPLLPPPSELSVRIINTPSSQPGSSYSGQPMIVRMEIDKRVLGEVQLDYMGKKGRHAGFQFGSGR